MSKFPKLLALLIIMFAFIVGASSVNAQSATPSPEKKLKPFRATESRQKPAELLTRDSKKASAAARRIQKLSEARLRICEARSKNISMRFNKLISMGNKSHEAQEMRIEKVDNYYNERLVPEGFSLDNYDDLKSDIDTKKANVKALLEKLQTNGQSFTCDSEDPKGQADTFRDDMKALISANKDYKTSVRTFVVAVRDLAKEARKEKVSPTPEVEVEVIEDTEVAL